MPIGSSGRTRRPRAATRTSVATAARMLGMMKAIRVGPRAAMHTPVT